MREKESGRREGRNRFFPRIHSTTHSKRFTTSDAGRPTTGHSKAGVKGEGISVDFDNWTLKAGVKGEGISVDFDGEMCTHTLEAHASAPSCART